MSIPTPTPEEQAQLDQRRAEDEARVLASLQSMAITVVALQEKAGEIAKFPHEVNSIIEKDVDLDSLREWLNEEEE